MPAADGVRVVGLDILAVALHRRRRLGRRPRGRPPRASTASTRSLHAATLHKPHVGSHSRQEFVDTNVTGTLTLLEEAVAAGVGALHLHQHHERVRPRADAAAGRAGGVDHRGRRAGPAQHLRRHQDGGREPLRALPPRPRAAVPDPAHVALLPGGRRPRRRPRRVRRRQPEGQRAALPPRRPRGRRERPPARARARARARLRPLHHQRHDAVHAATTSRSCARTRRPSCARLVPAYEAVYAARGWRMFDGIERVYDNARRARGARAGSRARTSATRSPACRPASRRAASSRSPSAPRAITRSRPAPTPCADQWRMRRRKRCVSGCSGAPKICAGRAALDDQPVVQEADLVGDLAREAHLVRGDQHRHALGLELAHDARAPRRRARGRARS